MLAGEPQVAPIPLEAEVGTVHRVAVNPNVLLSPVENGYVAFDIANETFFELNAVAALVVELCDGTRTAEALLSLVEPYVPQGALASVADWIVQAIDSRLLTVQQKHGEETQLRQLDADQLSQLAATLRGEGKTRAAFLCQQKVTDLSPGRAESWRELGELAHIVGDRSTARDAYQRYLELEPNDAEIQHLLVALRDEAPPERVPDECIRHLYERFSTCYESNMCDELGYEGPQHLFDVTRDHLKQADARSILDLGCGTGLAGEVFRPLAGRLVGVDLSEAMLVKARSRRIYDSLHTSEITEWLAREEQSYDVILACDTFIYFGDLENVISLASEKLNPGGTLSFSVEQAAEAPFRLTDSGRYEHHLDHINDVAAACRMSFKQHKTAFLRTEYGHDVMAHYVCLSRPN